MSLFLVATLILLVLFFAYMFYMPGRSYSGELPRLNDADKSMAERLKQHVTNLCKNPTGRNFIEKLGLDSAKKYIADQFGSSGYQVKFQEYQFDGDVFANIEVQISGTTHPEEIVIIGAHYDAVIGAPGANDNGSGVAAILELVEQLENKKYPRTVRFVAFVNEEPPNSFSGKMGSYVYAKRSKDKNENVVAMFSLETIGYFRDDPGSQHYPPFLSLFYPNRGNFIAFVGNLHSRRLVSNAIRLFRAHTNFPSEGIVAPAIIPGVSWSDHWSFWQHGFPGIMVTDTALYRYPYYHTAKDTPDKVDYEKMVYVVKGLQKVIEGLLY